MLHTPSTIERPQRWDVPFGQQMGDADVDRLLQIEPFCSMDPQRFPARCSLRDLLLNDTRIGRYQAGDIVVREGDYGGSAFLILQGRVQVVLESLPRPLLGRNEPRRKGLLAALAQFFHARYPEVRPSRASQPTGRLAQRHDGSTTRIFLQDVPGVLNQHHTLSLGAGQIFGELAALTRTPRTATVLVDEEAELLEIRWQGLRDLMRRDPALRQHIDQLYRQNSLATHLRETPLLRDLSEEQVRRLVEATVFETHGDFEWQRAYQQTSQLESAERIAQEPLIAVEGSPPEGLLLIRNGFARVSRQYGNGHRTFAYLGKGEIFGLEELAFQAQHGRPLVWQRSLRAVGYVDVLRIPAALVQQQILPNLPASDVQQLVARAEQWQRAPARPTPGGTVKQELDTGMLEFIVENRLMNGTQAMVINLDRCTRCDDCVRACAATHNNNPRFVRHGPRFDRFMFANACMHCVDPVCMIGCPTGAISRDAETGTVIINDDTCIGCASCANSCPYHNIRMVEIRDRRGQFIVDQTSQQPITKATKCDLCAQQLAGPACQQACPHDALERIDLRDLARLQSWLQR